MKINMNWLHYLFNPHCQHCIDEAESSRICNNCEYFKQQISILQQERDKLLNQLLTPITGMIQNELTENPVPLNTSRFIPFSVKRQELETRDREMAKQQGERIKKEYNKNIESLEKEILSAKIDLSGVNKDAAV